MLGSRWPKVPITDVLSFIVDNRGKTVPTSEAGFPLIATNCVLNERLYPVFDKVRYVSEEILNSWFRAHLQPNDILFVNKGTPGRCCLVPNPVTFCVAQDMVGLRCNSEKIYYKYLLMALRAPSTKKFISNYHVGIAIPHFKKEDFSNLLIPLPEMDEQIALGDAYFSLCEAIENNNAICADLEGMAKLLYDYWFVQFDFPDENGKPYKSSGGKMVWNEELKREIPDGWRVSELGNECEIMLGGTPDTSKPDYWNGNIPWLNSGEVAFSPVLWSEKSITRKGMENSATAFAEVGSVVMSITRYIRPSILGIDACFNQSVVAVKPTETLHTSYIYPVLKSNVDRYMKLRTGAQQPHINKETVEDTVVVCPTESVLKKYYKAVEPIYDLQMNTSKETQQLAELRDFLLPMLMNGQVKVGKETAS